MNHLLEDEALVQEDESSGRGESFICVMKMNHLSQAMSHLVEESESSG